MKFYVVIIDATHKITGVRCHIQFATGAPDAERAYEKCTEAYDLVGVDINSWVAMERDDVVCIDCVVI